uniref:Uncharacterized protein n=1 Tax=Setaria italica TaxID=4555 RepID=K3ZGT6_SETIT
MYFACKYKKIHCVTIRHQCMILHSIEADCSEQDFLRLHYRKC